MSEASQQPETVVATGAWVWRVLGIVWGAAILISLVKSGFAIELHGLPLKVYQQYAWLRDMLFEPIVWVLRYFGLTMPWWLKDIVMGYGLGAGAMWRASEYDDVRVVRGGKDLKARIRRTVAWPRRIYSTPRVIRKVKARITELKSYLRERRLSTSESDAYLLEIRWLELHLVHWRDQYQGFLRNIILAVLAALAFFVWNHLQNVLGPGG